MIRQAHHRNRRATAGGTRELRDGGLEQLDGGTARFDIIYSTNALQFFPDMLATFKLLRLLLQAGDLCPTSEMPCLAGASQAAALKGAGQIRQRLKAAGLTDLRKEELTL